MRFGKANINQTLECRRIALLGLLSAWSNFANSTSMDHIYFFNFIVLNIFHKVQYGG
jgi:hypothetical protein